MIINLQKQFMQLNKYALIVKTNAGLTYSVINAFNKIVKNKWIVTS